MRAEIAIIPLPNITRLMAPCITVYTASFHHSLDEWRCCCIKYYSNICFPATASLRLHLSWLIPFSTEEPSSRELKTPFSRFARFLTMKNNSVDWVAEGGIFVTSTVIAYHARACDRILCQEKSTILMGNLFLVFPSP